MIPEPCRSFLTRCFRLSFQQPSGLYLSVAAPYLPSRSSACRMILARVRSCMCIKRLDVTAITFTNEQDDPRALSLTDFWCFCLGFHLPAGQYLSVAAPALPSRLSARRMMLAFVRSFSCLSNDWMSLFRLHELAGRFQSLVAPFLLGVAA